MNETRLVNPGTNRSILLKYLFFFWPLPLGCGVAAADTILLQPVLSWTSSVVVPIVLVSRLTQSIHLCFGLLLLLPGGTISRLFLPTYSLGVVPSRVSAIVPRLSKLSLKIRTRKKHSAHNPQTDSLGLISLTYLIDNIKNPW